MQRLNYQKLILLTLGIFTPLTITLSKVNASTFGAEIFCTMRDGGNDHESSWDAAYTYIKQKINIISNWNFLPNNLYYFKSICKCIWSRNFLYYERWRK